MFCPNCGTNVQGGLEVCPECGTEITVKHTHASGGNESFIVAEFEDETNAPGSRFISENKDDTQQSAIIEAEEDELPKEYELTVEDRRQAAVTEDEATVASPDGRNSVSEREDREYSHTSFGDEPHSTVSLRSMSIARASDNPEQKPRSSGVYPFTELPPSRKSPLLAGLAIILLVGLGLSILFYGLPGGESGDRGLSVPTLLPTPFVNNTNIPPTGAPSENLILSISAYGGGYMVEIDKGLKADEVAKIVLSVEDDGGLHTMEWVYPSFRESFFMRRDAYNGTMSASEHITATAIFNDGKKEVVFSGDL